MTAVTQMTTAPGADEQAFAAARLAAGTFPDAPLAMPVQDMSPVSALDVLRELLPSVLRRRLSRGGAIRH